MCKFGLMKKADVLSLLAADISNVMLFSRYNFILCTLRGRGKIHNGTHQNASNSVYDARLHNVESSIMNTSVENKYHSVQSLVLNSCAILGDVVDV